MDRYAARNVNSCRIAPTHGSHQGVPAQLVLFRGFGHGLDRPKANRAAMQQNFDWFKQYLWE